MTHFDDVVFGSQPVIKENFHTVWILSNTRKPIKRHKVKHSRSSSARVGSTAGDNTQPVEPSTSNLGDS